VFVSSPSWHDQAIVGFKQLNVPSDCTFLSLCRCHCVAGYVVPRSQLAFSQPTQAGRRLAEQYTQTHSFLVYRGIYRPVIISVAFGTYTFTYAISKPTSQALCLQRTGLLATAQLINVVTKQLQVMTCELHFAVMKRQKPIISCPSSDIDCSLV